MTHDKAKETEDIDQQQANKDQAQELTDQELAKVSGGVARRGGDDDLDDLEVER